MASPDTVAARAAGLALRWPVPALAAWAIAWGAFVALRGMQAPAWAALGAGLLLPATLALRVTGPWRRLLLVAGFPLSALMLGAALPPWAWLAPLALLLLVYPVQAWSDAPIFPTSRAALRGIEAMLALPPAPRLLDAGCGLGHGMQALRAVWPSARIAGIERSALLARAARLRCPWAHVQRGDMWAESWSRFDLVYLFQRPESMHSAWRKACAEMAAGAWFVSLEFEVPGVEPHALLQHPGERAVRVYRLGGPAEALAAQPRRAGADKPPRNAHPRAPA